MITPLCSRRLLAVEKLLPIFLLLQFPIRLLHFFSSPFWSLPFHFRPTFPWLLCRQSHDRFFMVWNSPIFFPSSLSPKNRKYRTCYYSSQKSKILIGNSSSLFPFSNIQKSNQKAELIFEYVQLIVPSCGKWAFLAGDRRWPKGKINVFFEQWGAQEAGGSYHRPADVQRWRGEQGLKNGLLWGWKWILRVIGFKIENAGFQKWNEGGARLKERELKVF